MPASMHPVSSGVKGRQPIKVGDIEEIVPSDPRRWVGHKRRKGKYELRDYVKELLSHLKEMKEERLSRTPPVSLEMLDFDRATSEILKRGYPTTRKSEVIHVYRDLVREGIVTPDQEIENLFIKKLSKSTFGGVNVSIFLPPGHNAPMWSINIRKTSEKSFKLTVLERRSVYTLASYIDYVSKQPSSGNTPNDRLRRAQLVNGMHRILTTSEDVITFEFLGEGTRRKIKGNIFDIVSMEGQVSLNTLEIDQDVPGLLKGSHGIKSCTFGCVYCPTEVDKEGNQINPKSYLTREPGVVRAVRNDYSTTSQVYDRIVSLRDMGHECSKVFIRCVGGTWSVFTQSGQESFIRDILYALNTMDAPLGREKLSLLEEQQINETAGCRAVEICVEDHPKMVSYSNLAWARYLGITAIEMGIQTTDDAIHKLTKRDSTRAEIINRAMITKEFGFKTLAHVMPDLPGSTPEKDIAVIDDLMDGTERVRVADYRWIGAGLAIPAAVMCTSAMYYTVEQSPWEVAGNWRTLLLSLFFGVVVGLAVKAFGAFVDDVFGHVDYYLFDFDRWKLYPCMVLEFSELKKWYQEGKFTPYFESLGPESLYKVIEHFMATVKPYMRVERVIRDVPASESKGRVNYVVAGINVTNAQQIVQARMKKKSVCLRTREINNKHTDVAKAKLFEHRYFANRGEEIFLSFETPCRSFVYGFVKLRFNNGPGREKERANLPPELQGAAIIRWLQVYGRALAIGGGGRDRSSQHVGFGRRLMDRAEEIARNRGYKKIADISGIGVREYYRKKLGYTLEGTYMVKYL